MKIYFTFVLMINTFEFGGGKPNILNLALNKLSFPLQSSL